MSSYGLVFLLVALSACMAFAGKPMPPKYPSTPKCGANEVFTKCDNNKCQRTCVNPSVAADCKDVVKAGCICAKGFLRNSVGACVAPKDCDCCKENEVFSECDNHACRNTCAEPDLITRCDPAPGCYPGCICADGFLKNADGVCVAEADCPAKIPECKDPNEVFNDSEVAIESCTNMNLGSQAGCACKAGFYYRSESDRTCVTEADCAAACGQNEQYYLSYGECELSCATRDGDVSCAAVSKRGCFCKSGFVRENGKCIDAKQCCGPFEIWMKNAPTCPETCENRKQKRPAGGKPGCACQTGYIRVCDGGKCIQPSKCPKKKY